jgi:hypothetical protein
MKPCINFSPQEDNKGDKHIFQKKTRNQEKKKEEEL